MELLAQGVQLLSYPLIWILLLLLVSWLKPALSGLGIKLSIVLLIVLSNPFLVNEVLSRWEPAPPAGATLAAHYQVCIVPGGFTQSDPRTGSQVATNKGADRLLQALRLWRQGTVGYILLTGGPFGQEADALSEASYMRQILLSGGVPAERILLEPAARNTWQNALYCKAIVHQRFGPATKCLLVTSAWHMPRAAASFRSAGLLIDTYPTDYLSQQRRFDLDAFTPQAAALHRWHQLFKEWLGLASYWLLGRI